jgi:hypothetical protein
MLIRAPTDEITIIANYTLSPDDIEVIGRRYGAPNRLGLASHIALMRHPGFGLSASNAVPVPILHYLAAQLNVDPTVLTTYGQRLQTRNDHAEIVAGYLGLRPFRRLDIPLALELAETAARYTDRGEPIVRALLEGLKDRRFILPAPDTLERAGLAGRARARERRPPRSLRRWIPTRSRTSTTCSSTIPISMTPLAWLRAYDEAPNAANINGLLERLRFVRAIGIDPAVGTAIPEFRFAQFVREGGVAPAFLLSDYGLNRRRATLAAAVVDLEARLADHAIQMFDRLIGGMFSRAKRGKRGAIRTASSPLAS